MRLVKQQILKDLSSIHWRGKYSIQLLVHCYILQFLKDIHIFFSISTGFDHPFQLINITLLELAHQPAFLLGSVKGVMDIYIYIFFKNLFFHQNFNLLKNTKFFVSFA